MNNFEYFKNLNIKIKKIGCGFNFSNQLNLILIFFKFKKKKKEKGKLYCVGYNGHGELGNNNNKKTINIEKIPFFIKKIILELKTSKHHSLSISC
jgi:alpha-tubulin suppressor-like RCC1 family protein